MKWYFGIPPNTGDKYMVKFIDNKIKEIFFCPQQGWIDDNWNFINIDEIVKYYYLES